MGAPPPDVNDGGSSMARDNPRKRQ